MESKTEINICELPLTVLVDIFKLVSIEDLVYSVRLTCKLWYQLSHEGALWKRLDVLKMFPWKCFNEQEFLKLLSVIQDSVESIKFDLLNRVADSDMPGLDPGIITHEGIHCRNLHKISVTTSSFGSRQDQPFLLQVFRALNRVSEKYPNLKSLKLHSSLSEYFKQQDLRVSDIWYYPDSEQNVVTQEISQIFDDIFPNLEKLTVTGCDGAFDLRLTSFTKNHQQLKSLEVNFRFIRRKRFADIVTIVCLTLPHLETLILENYTVYDAISMRLEDIQFEEIDEEYAQNVEEFKLLQLKMLVLTNRDRSIDDACLKRIVQYASKLEYLSIGGVDCITNTGMEHVSHCCPNLKQLCLCPRVKEDKERTSSDNHIVSNITDAGIERIVEQCHWLTVLDLTCCSELTDLVIEAIATHCPRLEELNVMNSLAISDKSICAIAKRSKMLRKLNVSFCAKLTAKSLSSVIKGCRYLQCLQANSCHRVSDLNIGTIEPCPGEDCVLDSSKVLTSLEAHSHITKLEFTFCANLTNASMKQIGAQCKDLRSLNIQACSLVTNAGVKEVMKGCVYLRDLDISGGSISQTTRLNDDCLRTIGDLGQNLEALTICKNAHITAQAVFHVVKHCPNMSVIYVDDNMKSGGSNRQALIQCSGEVTDKTIALTFFHSRTRIMVYKNKEMEDRSCM